MRIRVFWIQPNRIVEISERVLKVVQSQVRVAPSVVSARCVWINLDGLIQLCQRFGKLFGLKERSPACFVLLFGPSGRNKLWSGRGFKSRRRLGCRRRRAGGEIGCSLFPTGAGSAAVGAGSGTTGVTGGEIFFASSKCFRALANTSAASS